MKNRYLLVFSASIGNGHNQAAKAFLEAWEEKYPMQGQFVDFLKEQTVFDRLTQWGYEFLIQHFPWLYDWMYRISDIGWIGSFMRWQTGIFCSSRIQKTVQDCAYPPAGLVFTHPTPANAASALKKKGQLPFPLIGIVTDFAIHQLWKDTGLDFYVIPNKELVSALTDLGIPKEKILPAGIPIGSSFWDASPSSSLESTTLNILVAGGGWGMGPLKEAVLSLENLSRPCKITLITGKNQELEKEMQSYISQTKNELEVVGYTSKMADYMKSADLFITKSGGLSTSESFACGTPLLLLPGRAGQEEDNWRFFERHGAALAVNHVREIPFKVEQVLQSSRFQKDLTVNAILLGKPKAALQAAEAVEKLLEDLVNKNQ